MAKQNYGGSGKEKPSEPTMCEKSGSGEGDFATPASKPSVKYLGSGGSK